MRAKPERYGTLWNTATIISQSEWAAAAAAAAAPATTTATRHSSWGVFAGGFASVGKHRGTHTRTNTRAQIHADPRANPVQSECARGVCSIFIIDFNVNT